jgi:hypothetical protein
MYVPCILYSLLSIHPFIHSFILIVPAYRKHQHSDYTHKTVHTVHTATKLTTSMYCNYNS